VVLRCDYALYRQDAGVVRLRSFGIPGRLYVVTRRLAGRMSFQGLRRAQAMGAVPFGVMLVTLTLARMVLRHGTCRQSPEGMPPRAMTSDGCGPLIGIRWGYIVVAFCRCGVAAHLFRALCHGDPAADGSLTLGTMNRLQIGLGGPALINQPGPWHLVATLGVPTYGVLAWISYRSRMPGSGAAEDVNLFPQAVPRLVSAWDCWGRDNPLISPGRSQSKAPCGSWTRLLHGLLPIGLRPIASVVAAGRSSLEEWRASAVRPGR